MSEEVAVGDGASGDSNAPAPAAVTPSLIRARITDESLLEWVRSGTKVTMAIDTFLPRGIRVQSHLRAGGQAQHRITRTDLQRGVLAVAGRRGYELNHLLEQDGVDVLTAQILESAFWDLMVPVFALGQVYVDCVAGKDPYLGLVFKDFAQACEAIAPTEFTYNNVENKATP